MHPAPQDVIWFCKDRALAPCHLNFGQDYDSVTAKIKPLVPSAIAKATKLVPTVPLTAANLVCNWFI